MLEVSKVAASAASAAADSSGLTSRGWAEQLVPAGCRTTTTAEEVVEGEEEEVEPELGGELGVSSTAAGVRVGEGENSEAVLGGGAQTNSC